MACNRIQQITRREAFDNRRCILGRWLHRCIARLIGARLQERLGRPVVIEDKPGATGQIGTRYVARAEPDGNTLQIAADTHAVAPALYSKLGYDPVKDFTPIILVAWSPLVLVSNPALPVSSVKELVEYLKSKPGEISYATGGRGDGSHLAALFFNKLAEVNSVAIPFQGDGQALPQVLGNHVPSCSWEYLRRLQPSPPVN